MYRSLCFLVVLSALGLVAPQAQAAILAQFDANYVGFIKDGIPASEAEEVGYITKLITLAAGAPQQAIAPADGQLYDRIGSTLVVAGGFDAPTTTGFVKVTGPNTATFSGTFQYILAKYDGPNFGSVVWYSDAGFTDVTLPTTMGGFGLSHISAYNNGPSGGPEVMPEPISLAVWGIGLGCFGAISLRRRKR